MTTTSRPLRLTLLLTVVVAVVIGSAGVAMAGDPGVSGDGDGDTAVIKGHDDGDDQTSDNGSGGTPVIKIPQPYKEYRYIPNCSANDVDGGADALCGAAVYTCPRDGDIRYRVYTRQHDADGSVAKGADWEPAGTQCRGPNDPPEGGPVVITTADIADEARKAAPATVVHVEPVATSYVNVPTNFYSDAAGLDATVQVLGQTVSLRFEPSGYAWTFGDGSTGTGVGVKGADVGGPGAVEHAYRRSGTVSVTLARTFDVTFRVGGTTGTLPAPGVSNTSAPYPLQIGEVQSLVRKTP